MTNGAIKVVMVMERTDIAFPLPCCDRLAATLIRRRSQTRCIHTNGGLNVVFADLHVLSKSSGNIRGIGALRRRYGLPVQARRTIPEYAMVVCVCRCPLISIVLNLPFGSHPRCLRCERDTFSKGRTGIVIQPLRVFTWTNNARVRDLTLDVGFVPPDHHDGDEATRPLLRLLKILGPAHLGVHHPTFRDVTRFLDEFRWYILCRYCSIVQQVKLAVLLLDVPMLGYTNMIAVPIRVVVVGFKVFRLLVGELEFELIITHLLDDESELHVTAVCFLTIRVNQHVQRVPDTADHNLLIERIVTRILGQYAEVTLPTSSRRIQSGIVSGVSTRVLLNVLDDALKHLCRRNVRPTIYRTHLDRRTILSAIIDDLPNVL